MNIQWKSEISYLRRMQYRAHELTERICVRFITQKRKGKKHSPLETMWFKVANWCEFKLRAKRKPDGD